MSNIVDESARARVLPLVDHLTEFAGVPADDRADLIVQVRLGTTAAEKAALVELAQLLREAGDGGEDEDA